MKKKLLTLSVLLVFTSIVFVSCNDDDDDDKPMVNLFSVSDDIELGQQVKQEIETNDSAYTILDSAQYADAYAHLYRIRNNILASGKVKYEDEFPWYMRIIDNDSTVNAFACPGGYMYFYTGIIKYLDNEAQFAGVMAHEMGHVDRRHSTSHLTKIYGVTTLLGLIFGEDPGLLARVTASLLALKFSRENEYDADKQAVTYLYETDYHAPSLGDFFEKLEGMPQTPAFLSTHPSPEDRLEKINEVWTNLGGEDGQLFESSYQDFKNTLP